MLMTVGKESVAVHIAGHEYKIRSDGDADALREIAGYVDQAMSRVRKRTGTVDTLDVAVLTCLNLAREILTLRGSQAPAGATSVGSDEMRKLIGRVEATLRNESASLAEEAPQEAAEGKSDQLADSALSEEQNAEVVSESGARSEAPLPDQVDAASAAKSEAARPAQVEMARTLDLPSFEALRDRASGARARAESEADGEGEAEMPEPRVAAGGRDRAS
jgi:cell division protein ZapA (FtsZ GTPase activity inhibitor)